MTRESALLGIPSSSSNWKEVKQKDDCDIKKSRQAINLNKTPDCRRIRMQAGDRIELLGHVSNVSSVAGIKNCYG